METIIILVFVIGYVLITLEHNLHINKTVTALVMAAVSWALLSVGLLTVYDIEDGLRPYYEEFLTAGSDVNEAKRTAIENSLVHHMGKIAEILFFLIGAMTIVEIIDLHRGFHVIKNYVKTNSKQKLLWIIGILAFLLSSVIDNLTATIVLISILRKIIPVREDRIWYSALVVIAANAGGAWSPIGDVTTTMLWIAKKVSAVKLIEFLVLPSLICFALPFFIASRLKAFRGVIHSSETETEKPFNTSTFMLTVGILAIIAVPVFKTLTHLPPYIGMILSLGIVWLIAEKTRPQLEDDVADELPNTFTVHHALSRIEMSGILFFLGILLTVAALESLGLLYNFAGWISENIPSQDLVVMILGTSSAVIDNVPLVAAAIGMFLEPMDAELWHFIAFAAGTGGSMLIIGSAAGVAAMGMEKIEFYWYLKNISWLAAIGFVAGSLLIISFRLMGFYG